MTATSPSHGLPCLARSKPTPETVGVVTTSKVPKRRDTDNVGVGSASLQGAVQISADRIFRWLNTGQ